MVAGSETVVVARPHGFTLHWLSRDDTAIKALGREGAIDRENGAVDYGRQGRYRFEVLKVLKGKADGIVDFTSTPMLTAVQPNNADGIRPPGGALCRASVSFSFYNLYVLARGPKDGQASRILSLDADSTYRILGVRYDDLLADARGKPREP